MVRGSIGKLLFVLSVLLLAGGSWAAEVSSGNPRLRLVILGASYAGDWRPLDIPGLEIENRGVGGDETSGMLSRFEKEVVPLKPNLVLVWGHINSIHRAPGGDYEAAKRRIIADYEELISLALSSGIRPILATEVTLPEAIGLANRLAAILGRLRGKEGYSARINRHVRDVNEWLRNYARVRQLQLLDFEAQLDDGAGFRKAEFTTADGSHITQEGYEVLTRLVRNQLKFR